MITNFKIFENDEYNFKVGDYVYVIDISDIPMNHDLKYDTKYKLIRIYKSINKQLVCDLEYISDNGEPKNINFYYLRRFIPEEEYLFRNKIKKYNL
jgi:hypothetical protein